jgi:hypothetical protein
MLPCPSAVSQLTLYSWCNHYLAHSLALPIQPIRVDSPPLGTVLECVEPESAEPVYIGGSVHDTNSPFRGRFGSRYEGGQEELSEVEVAENVGSKLEVVSIVREHLYGWTHDAAAVFAIKRQVEGTIQRHVRIVEENMKLILLSVVDISDVRTASSSPTSRILLRSL